MKVFLTSLFVGSKKRSTDAAPDTIHPDTTSNLLLQANAAVRIENYSLAASVYQQLVETGSINPDVYVSYGYALLNLREFSKAKIALLKAIELDAQSADAHYMLGTAYNSLGDIACAQQAWEASYKISPLIENLYCDLCLLLFKQGKHHQAKAVINTGIEQFPRNANMYFYLGNLHSEGADFAAALGAYEQSRQLNPDSPYMLSSYSSALRQTGDLALSAELTMRALSLAPGEPSIHNNYLLGLQYSPAHSKKEKFDAHIEFAKQFEVPLMTHWGNYKNNLTIGRKIRIGYVSGDFRNHSLIFFIAPILANHDKTKFEVFCYHAHPSHDADTQRIRELADCFVDCYAMTDEALASKVRVDEIDILIDLSGHTGYNRLLVFARKPAPIQMTWLGYQSTTGLSAIDYRISEEALDPTGTSEAFHSEKLLRLPSSGTFSPLPDSPPVNKLPALSGAAFTFACLNNPSKITNEAIALWSQILAASPASRLMIGNATPALVGKFSLRFLAHNIDLNRIIFQPKVGLRQYLQLHHQVDMALDTFPYNGGTTTLHSLWMGVPVLALEGEAALSKVGAAIMHGLSLDKFCCASPQSYVERAAYFSTQLAELDVVRQSLRMQMDAMMQFLAKQVTGWLENSFEECWGNYRKKALQDQQKSNAE